MEILLGKAQPEVVALEVGRVAVPPRHMAIHGVMAPAATTTHAVRARGRSFWI